jgi:membrane associated rhomboid family serine protease
VAFESRRAAYRESLERPWRPDATYTLLGIIGAIYVAQIATLATRPELHNFLFVIHVDWYLRVWSLVTSTLAHDPGDPAHIFLNGIMLFFFGPTVERVLGQRRFLVLFFLAWAISGVVQVHLDSAFGDGHGALGASGALMAIFGLLMVLMPRSQILVWGFVPVPMWIAGIGYALIDVFGAFNPHSPIGNFAHLSGMAMGLVYGVNVKRELKRRRMELVTD